MHLRVRTRRVPRMRRAASISLVTASVLLATVCAIAACGSPAKSSDTRPLVTFAKSGGIAGKASSLVIDRGGGSTLTTYPPKTKTFVLDGDKRDELVRSLNAIKGLRPSYEPARPTADDFRYSVTYQGRNVQASGSAQLPGSLRSLIDLLDGIVKDEG